MGQTQRDEMDAVANYHELGRLAKGRHGDPIVGPLVQAQDSRSRGRVVRSTKLPCSADLIEKIALRGERRIGPERDGKFPMRGLLARASGPK